MKKLLALLIFFFALLFISTSGVAEIRVLSVKGAAAYKIGRQWTPLKQGMLLAVGTKVSTSVRSSVELKINNNTVTVKPLTIMKITENVFNKTSSATRLGLRRGIVRVRVNRQARVKTVFKVSTPVATASVRGSATIVLFGPTLGMRVIVLSDIIEAEGANSGPMFLYGNLQFWQKLSKGDPESPMAGMEDFVTKTHALFITLDEEKAFQLFGDDFMFYEPGQRGVQGQGAMVPVSIYLIWPQ
jgi:hypothetical protein